MTVRTVSSGRVSGLVRREAIDSSDIRISVTNMKREYKMSARADTSRQTGERILAAASARFNVALFDEVTLDEIAADAGVTVQTVIRRFGSKEGIVAALGELWNAEIQGQRSQAPVGDLAGAVTNLLDNYEANGDVLMHLLRQENRVPTYAAFATGGRNFHIEWCAEVFAPWLDGRSGVARKRLSAQLVTICDVYTWHLLRRQQGLTRRQTGVALHELLEGVLG